MPFTSERLEAGIVLQQFSGVISLTQFFEAQNAAMQILEDSGDAHIVAILDMSEASVTMREISINSIRQVTRRDDGLTIGFVIIGASHGMRMFTNVIKQVLSLIVVHANDSESAVLKARQILEAHNQG